MLEAMKQMFGYGHPQARLWVVGLEEHCEDDSDIEERIRQRSADRRAFLDVVEFHLALGKKMPEGVAVWDHARKIYAGVYGTDTEPGRLDPTRSDLLLGEILPLPRSQHSKWPAVYQDALQMGLNEYVTPVRSDMVRRLVQMVAKHRPEIVLLHGKTQHNRWLQRRDSPLKTDWHKEVVVGSARHSVLWQCVNGTLWVRTNNLVNNGWVDFGPDQIAQVVDIIRRALPSCRIQT
jgi:hypothetical protein